MKLGKVNENLHASLCSSKMGISYSTYIMELLRGIDE
jgi:hypothetical protein